MALRCEKTKRNFASFVALADPEIQAGLDAAVEDLKAVRQGIELLTDRLDIVEFGNGNKLADDAYQGLLPAPERPANPEERRERLDTLVQLGLLPDHTADLPVEQQDKAIIQAEAIRDLGETNLFGNLPEQV